MKKVVLALFVGLLSFAIGLGGVYLAMPSLAPDKVDGIRKHLDSLELFPGGLDDAATLATLPDSLLPDSLSPADSAVLISALPNPQDIIQSLRDSLYIARNKLADLSRDTSSLASQVRELKGQLSTTTTELEEAASLSKTLVKLDDKQLGVILKGLHLTTIELVYQQASARERARLLQVMHPDQAARFVRTLVNGPAPSPEVASTDQSSEPAAEENGADTLLR